MIPLATTISAAIPMPLEISPGMIPVLVLLAFLALGSIEIARAAFAQRHRPTRTPQRVAPTTMRPPKRAFAA